jgi:uncharacterized membrane protein YozB (DUF420 family)
MEHDQDRAIHGKAARIPTGKRHILFLAAVLIILGLVALHLAFANSIDNAGRFSLKNPLFCVMIAAFVLVGAFKVTYLWRFRNSIGKQFRK